METLTGGDASIFEMDYGGCEEHQAKREKIDLHRTGAKPICGHAEDARLPGMGYHTVGVPRTKVITLRTCVRLDSVCGISLCVQSFLVDTITD